MTAVLAVNGISQRFGGLQALDNVSFTVNRGQIVSLIGPNGAGKSTLLNIVSGLNRPVGGETRFLGRPSTGVAPHHLAAMGMGRTFQIARTFPRMTTLENIAVGYFPRLRQGHLSSLLQLPAARKEVRAALEKARELASVVGLAARVDEQVQTLPYGQIRLVEVARALAADPALILLDEPAAGLHPGEVAAFREVLRNLNAGGITILLVEHHMNLVMEVSDHIVVLHHGQKLTEGSPESVRADARVIEAYLGRGYKHASH